MNLVSRSFRVYANVYRALSRINRTMPQPYHRLNPTRLTPLLAFLFAR